MNPKSKASDDTTARNLAYSFVITYGVILLLVGCSAIAIHQVGQDNPWLDLLKSGLLLLGGGLTTIIGYYFGSRGVENAQKVAEAAREGYEELERGLPENAEGAPTIDENALRLPPE